MAAFIIPPTGHPAREAMGDLASVVEILDRKNIDKLPTFQEAVRMGRQGVAKAMCATAVNIICLRADDERWLIRVGTRGGWRKLWNFGRG